MMAWMRLGLGEVVHRLGQEQEGFELSRSSRLARRCSLAAILAVILALGPLLSAQTGNPVVIKVKSTPATPLAFGFSGVNTPQLRNGVEYFDPKFMAAVTPLKVGWVRYPAGTASMAFDWNPANPTGGHINIDWMNSLIAGNPPAVTGQAKNILVTSQLLTQAKGGVWLSDFATFARTLGAAAILCFNSYTDTNPGSANQMALAAQSYLLHISEWELGNEAYLYPLIYPTAASYASASFPYFSDIRAASPTALVGLFPAGLYPGMPGDFSAWDQGFQSYTPQYWNAMSSHIYPIAGALDVQTSMFTLNGILAHGSSDYVNSYVVPLMGPNTPIYITELNCCSSYSDKFLSYLYNGIFLAEYIARLSTVPNVKAVGVNSLYTDNADSHGLIQSVDDFENYLIGQVNNNPNFSTNTAIDTNTQFQFYTSAPGLAMEVANQAINTGQHLLPTTVTGGPTVKILGFDGNPIPAIFAQAYLPNNSHHNVLITNKSSQSPMVTIELNGHKVTDTLNLTYVSNTSPTAANTAQAQSTVQIQKIASSNPIHLTPYSVTCVTW